MKINLSYYHDTTNRKGFVIDPSVINGTHARYVIDGNGWDHGRLSHYKELGLGEGDIVEVFPSIMVRILKIEKNDPIPNYPDTYTVHVERTYVLDEI